jgi:hypothetical protein
VTELPLVVAILLPGRLVEYLDLRIQRLLLPQRPAHIWIRELDAVLCVHLPHVCGLWTAHRNDRVLDGLCICPEDLRRYQSRLR